MMRYRLLGLLLLVGVWLPSLPAPAAERVALVIGNSAYAHTSRLHNPGNDAREVAAALERLGFAVTRVDEADYDGLRRTLSAFREVSRGAELALLYYAGHAIQVDGRNYLVPVDARVRDPSDVELQLVALHIALQQLQAPLNVVILDACRDNPFAESLRSAAQALNRNIHLGRGLERVDPGLVGGAYLMMAAAPGAVAQDGPAGGHSPYTAALLEHLETPELDLRFLHARVRAAVERRTGGRQSPEAIDRLPPEPVHLAGGERIAPPPAVTAEALELAYWRSIRDSEDAADYRDYLERFPEGTFRTLAERRLAALRTPEPRPPSVEPEPRWISGARVNVRSGPGAGHGVVTQLVQGQEVQWLGSSERDPSWQRIRLDDGREAYAHGTLLSREQIAAAPPPPTPPTDRPPSGGPEMVLIRGGTFMMGSPSNEAERRDNERRHRVTVGDFHIGRYAVTFDEYDRFARATGRGLPNDRGWGRGRRPVINVNWYDATAYAEWLSQQTGQQYRLPTEAEWEYACRAGGRHRYCGGDDVDAVAWYRDNSGGRTRPVGEKQPNAWGLYDMSGNAWEWTCSRYDRKYGGAEQRCAGANASGSRVLRGGSWFNNPSRVRSASRNGDTPVLRIYFRGLRLARSP